eukprot:1283694-Karenia_brevis.AAC.1
MAANAINMENKSAGVQVSIFVLSGDFSDTARAIGKARLHGQASADYNTGKLRIRGIMPLPALPPGVAQRSLGEGVQAAMRLLQDKFRRGTVLMDDDGSNPRCLLPDLRNVTVELDEAALGQYHHLVESYAVMSAGMDAQPQPTNIEIPSDR